jgi:hypothetical protein
MVLFMLARIMVISMQLLREAMLFPTPMLLFPYYKGEGPVVDAVMARFVVYSSFQAATARGEEPVVGGQNSSGLSAVWDPYFLGIDIGSLT